MDEHRFFNFRRVFHLVILNNSLKLILVNNQHGSFQTSSDMSGQTHVLSRHVYEMYTIFNLYRNMQIFEGRKSNSRMLKPSLCIADQ